MPPRAGGICTLSASIFLAGVGFTVIERQPFSAGGGILSNPTGVYKKLWGGFGTVKEGGWQRSAVRGGLGAGRPRCDGRVRGA
jgi:hypothetical protein